MALFKRKGRDTPSGADLDRQTLQALVAAGADLRTPRNIRHFLYVRQAADAEQARRMLEADGYTVDVVEAASGPGWAVIAHRVQVVDEPSVTAARARFESLLPASAGADYDGWEAELVEG